MSNPINLIKILNKLITKKFSRNHANYIFFVTSKCNQNCEFCFYRNSINKKNDLSLSEVQMLSSKTGSITNLLISGGEPTLRKDLLEIIDIFVTKNNLKSLTIPSNGMLGNEFSNLAREIITKYPNLYLQVCISLDGPEWFHDKIRGINGAYKKSIESIKKLEDLARRYEKLSLNINTVITHENLSIIPEIIFLLQGLGIKFYTHSFEIMRPESITDKIIFNDAIRLKKAYNTILNYKDILFLNKIKGSFFKKITMAALHYANIYSLYKIQFDTVTKGKKWPMQCYAGYDNNVIYSNGDLSICELRKPVINIKDIPDNKKICDILDREKVKIKTCFCTHICYILLSMYRSKKILFLFMPLRALRYFLVKTKLLGYF
ncbi:MAG: hypothetical protein A2166_02675 [Omnitrophica WOR_2 bacterium RBG_13_41_10]|nr:MAG: hypothetical protein A2166_02675 [Omnitrophica WOR_2 bacterium RBG_13_41_10]